MKAKRAPAAGAKQMKPTFVNWLKFTERCLSAGHDDRWGVWHTMTAMRGPDSEDDALKQRTTQVLRKRAFPKTEFIGYCFHSKLGEYDTASHFGGHVWDADRVLKAVGR